MSHISLNSLLLASVKSRVLEGAGGRADLAQCSQCRHTAGSDAATAAASALGWSPRAEALVQEQAMTVCDK